MPKKKIIAITTFNRIEKLKVLIKSIKKYQPEGTRAIIIADDGSTDGTLDYIATLQIPNTNIKLIRNNRQGVHHQFNTVIKELEAMDFDYCFKCDDDIKFVKSGWDQLYIEAINKAGYDHLCHYNIDWRKKKNLRKPIEKNGLISHCHAKDVQGAFFTITPKVIETIGYMDIENFGFRGVGHVDYTVRACRAGFNDIDHPFDVQNSNDYIQHQTTNYTSALDMHLQNALESDQETKRKYTLIHDETRGYIAFNTNDQPMTNEVEIKLLKHRIDDLETQKKWYETHYGHQPIWFVRLGKVINYVLKLFKW